MIVIDAKNMILGRIATKIAKLSLNGETINLINCEDAVISGNKKTILASYKRRQEMGIHTKGPFLPKMPDRFVRRTIRGMLPYKTPRGREAYKRVMCYSGIPEQFSKETLVKFEHCSLEKLPSIKYLSVKEICKFLGAKQNE